MNIKSEKWFILHMIVFSNPEITYSEAIQMLKEKCAEYGIGA